MQGRVTWSSVAVAVLFLLVLASPANAESAPAAVELGSGTMGRFAWGASIQQPEDSAELEEGDICLAIGMFEPTGPHTAEGSEVASCGPPPAPQPVVETLVGGWKGKWRTVLAVVLPAEAKALEIRALGRRPRKFRLRLLSAQDAAPVSGVPLSYFVHGFLGQLRQIRLVAYRSDGSVLSDGPA